MCSYNFPRLREVKDRTVSDNPFLSPTIVLCRPGLTTSGNSLPQGATTTCDSGVSTAAGQHTLIPTDIRESFGLPATSSEQHLQDTIEPIPEHVHVVPYQPSFEHLFVQLLHPFVNANLQ